MSGYSYTFSCESWSSIVIARAGNGGQWNEIVDINVNIAILYFILVYFRVIFIFYLYLIKLILKNYIFYLMFITVC